MSSANGAIFDGIQEGGQHRGVLAVRDDPSVLAAGAAERSASGERPLDEFGGGEEPLGDDGAMVGFARSIRDIVPIRYLRVYLAGGRRGVELQ